MIRGLMTDDEWAIVEPFLTTPSLRGGRPPANHRRVLDGILWICRTGAPWRDLPEAFGNWNSIWRQFRRWCSLAYGMSCCRVWPIAAVNWTRCR